MRVRVQPVIGLEVGGDGKLRLCSAQLYHRRCRPRGDQTFSPLAELSPRGGAINTGTASPVPVSSSSHSQPSNLDRAAMIPVWKEFL
jgi:hypothetical protein